MHDKYVNCVEEFGPATSFLGVSLLVLQGFQYE